MLASLTKQGDQLLLPLDPEFVERLQLQPDTPLNIELEGESLIVSPVRDAERKEHLTKILRSVNRRYGRMLQRLAD